MERIVLVTGGFDPIHDGHLSLFEAAKELGDKLIVGLNSDEWLSKKKGQPFMPWNVRSKIVKNLSVVDDIISFDDSDGTAIDAIKVFWESVDFDKNIQLIFANGGDRKQGNVPEESFYYEGSQDSVLFANTTFEYGVGGDDKRNSSSWILQEWKEPKTTRKWGYYRVLHENGPNVKVKELTVDPGQRLSMPRHKHRAEHWFVSEGEASVYTLDSSTDMELLGKYTTHQSLHIAEKQWHMLANETDKPLKVVEIQYGANCVEEDIERK